MRRVTSAVIAASIAMGLLAACGGGSSTSAPAGGGTGTTRTTTASSVSVANAPTNTVWLCQPGVAPDPCAGDLTTTVVQADGGRSTLNVQAPSDPPIDCFYVYPTVSTETTINADLTIQAGETNVARAQAAQFSQVCRVWAPMYRQITLSKLFPYAVSPQYVGIAYGDVRNAWLDYLAHYNHGRRVVLISHSQGTQMLIGLLRNEIENDPAQSRLLVSAILAGGNVQVPTGKLVGGSFDKTPLCTTATQTGCVVAWSTFLQPPPANSLFGRPGQGVSTIVAANNVPSPAAGMQVACVNPAGPGATGTPLLPLTPSGGASGPWVEYPGLYSAQCESADGATWLQVDVHHTAGDARPVVTEAQGPIWGLHVVDINLPLGNLVNLVRTESGQAATGP